MERQAGSGGESITRKLMDDSTIITESRLLAATIIRGLKIFGEISLIIALTLLLPSRRRKYSP